MELEGIVTEGGREFSLFSQTLTFLLILADCDKGFHGVGTHWSHKLISHHQHLELKAIRQQQLRSLLLSLRIYVALYI